MAPEARMGLLLGLYHMGKYKEVMAQYEQQKGMKMPTKEGQVRLLMLMGQTAYKLKEYQKGAEFFLEAEKPCLTRRRPCRLPSTGFCATRNSSKRICLSEPRVS